MSEFKNKDLVNRIRFSSSMKKELEQPLKNLSASTRIPTSKLLDEAIEDLLKKYNIDFKQEA